MAPAIGQSAPGFTLARDGAVAVVTFNQPHKLNALERRQLIAFGRMCRTLTEDAHVRCVVITGEGKGFCSGADITERPPAANDKSTRPVRFKDTDLDFITPLVECPKPTIAAINGIAVGGGLGIALACDLRICGESGAFLANFGDLGIPAVDGVPWLLPRLVGIPRALEMLYTCDRIDARRAEAAGLVNRVVADADLIGEALGLARRIAEKPPVAIQMTKAAVMGGAGRSWREALNEQEFAYISTVAFASGDMREAMLAKREKRSASFADFVPYAPELPGPSQGTDTTAKNTKSE